MGGMMDGYSGAILITIWLVGIWMELRQIRKIFEAKQEQERKDRFK